MAASISDAGCVRSNYDIAQNICHEDLDLLAPDRYRADHTARAGTVNRAWAPCVAGKS